MVKNKTLYISIYPETKILISCFEGKGKRVLLQRKFEVLYK